jgi:tRNA (Thr-GGU) A37 N-methylase
VKRRDAELFVEDLDVLDGTPLLDIKPYVEGFDLRLGTRGGWTEQVSSETFRRRGGRQPDGR